MLYFLIFKMYVNVGSTGIYMVVAFSCLKQEKLN